MDPTSSQHRLVAVALLIRIGLNIKSWADRIRTLISETLVVRLPPLTEALDPDERLYVAAIWRFCAATWLCDFLAAGAAREEGGDRVRSECLEGLLTVAPSLTAALEKLLEELQRVWFDTLKPGDSMGRRLKRVFEALRKAYVAVPKEPTPDSGEIVRRLAIEPISRSGLPEKISVRAEPTGRGPALSELR
jgi:hypothetical protein